MHENNQYLQCGNTGGNGMNCMGAPGNTTPNPNGCDDALPAETRPHPQATANVSAAHESENPPPCGAGPNDRAQKKVHQRVTGSPTGSTATSTRPSKTTAGLTNHSPSTRAGKPRVGLKTGDKNCVSPNIASALPKFGKKSGPNDGHLVKNPGFFGSPKLQPPQGPVNVPVTLPNGGLLRIRIKPQPLLATSHPMYTQSQKSAPASVDSGGALLHTEAHTCGSSLIRSVVIFFAAMILVLLLLMVLYGWNRELSLFY